MGYPVYGSKQNTILVFNKIILLTGEGKNIFTLNTIIVLVTSIYNF